MHTVSALPGGGHRRATSCKKRGAKCKKTGPFSLKRKQKEILLHTERMDGLPLCQDKEVCIGRMMPLLQSTGAGSDKEW